MVEQSAPWTSAIRVRHCRAGSREGEFGGCEDWRRPHLVGLVLIKSPKKYRPGG